MNFYKQMLLEDRGEDTGEDVLYDRYVDDMLSGRKDKQFFEAIDTCIEEEEQDD